MRRNNVNQMMVVVVGDGCGGDGCGDGYGGSV